MFSDGVWNILRQALDCAPRALEHSRVVRDLAAELEAEGLLVLVAVGPSRMFSTKLRRALEHSRMFEIATWQPSWRPKGFSCSLWLECGSHFPPWKWQSSPRPRHTCRQNGQTRKWSNLSPKWSNPEMVKIPSTQESLMSFYALRLSIIFLAIWYLVEGLPPQN